MSKTINTGQTMAIPLECEVGETTTLVLTVNVDCALRLVITTADGTVVSVPVAREVDGALQPSITFTRGREAVLPQLELCIGESQVPAMPGECLH